MTGGSDVGDMSLADRLDPFEASYLADPYGIFFEARCEEPVFYSDRMDAWVVSRYDDVKRLLSDHSSCSSRNTLRPVQPFTPEVRQILQEGGYRGARILLNSDPPDHASMRSLLRGAFTPRRLAALEPAIRRIVHDHVDAFERDGQADIVRQLTYGVPALVIFIMLGVPEEDVPRVKSWARNWVVFMCGKPSPGEQAVLAGEFVSFWQYCEDLVERRLEAPGEDLVSDLVRAAQGDGAQVTLCEIASAVFALLLAGHETTTGLLGNGLRQLLSRPSVWEELRSDPTLIPRAVEEVLRFDSPVIAGRRLTTRPVEVAGVTIPEGSPLVLLLGAGNRDEAQFPDSEHLDIHRDNAAHHLGFGFGVHYCLGAALARLEARVVLEVLTQRLPDLRLTPEQDLEFLPNTLLRCPQQLLLQWEAPVPAVTR
jgi:cytochrome P450